MSFDRNAYLEWYMPRSRRADGAINLHASGVASLTHKDLQVPDHDPWTVVDAFEKELAFWLGIDPAQVLFTPGATGGTLLALLSLTSRDDEILVERPVYEPMLRQAERLARVLRFSRRPEDGWSLPVEEILSLMSPATRMVMITEPGNPSGTFARRSDVLAVADAASKVGAVLLVNEVYLGYTQARTFHGTRDNVVVVSSLSKLVGAYWPRLGWLSGQEDIIHRLRMAHMNFSMATKPGAAVGLGVLARADELRRGAIALAASGRAVVDSWVAATRGLSWTAPQGPGFGCVLLPPHVTDDVRFAEDLHERQNVLVVPGSHFEVPGSLRLSWLQDGGRLDEGLAILADAIVQHRT